MSRVSKGNWQATSRWCCSLPPQQQRLLCRGTEDLSWVNRREETITDIWIHKRKTYAHAFMHTNPPFQMSRGLKLQVPKWILGKVPDFAQLLAANERKHKSAAGSLHRGDLCSVISPVCCGWTCSIYFLFLRGESVEVRRCLNEKLEATAVPLKQRQTNVHSFAHCEKFTCTGVILLSPVFSVQPLTSHLLCANEAPDVLRKRKTDEADSSGLSTVWCRCYTAFTPHGNSPEASSCLNLSVKPPHWL